MISLGGQAPHVHVRCTPVGRTGGEPGEIELTAIGGGIERRARRTCGEVFTILMTAAPLLSALNATRTCPVEGGGRTPTSAPRQDRCRRHFSTTPALRQDRVGTTPVQRHAPRQHRISATPVPRQHHVSTMPRWRRTGAPQRGSPAERTWRGCAYRTDDEACSMS